MTIALMHLILDSYFNQITKENQTEERAFNKAERKYGRR